MATAISLRTSRVLLVSSRRNLHLTHPLNGAPHGEDPIKNFEDFKYPNQVSTFEHHKLPKELLDNEYNYPVCRDTMGIRWPGYWFKRNFVYVKEMEPELVVPDLENFELKAYVSHRVEDVDVEPFTAKDLFEAVYARKIVEDFRNKNKNNNSNNDDDNGDNNNVEEYKVSQEEIDEARLKAMQTGSDLFEDFAEDGVRAKIEFVK